MEDSQGLNRNRDLDAGRSLEGCRGLIVCNSITANTRLYKSFQMKNDLLKPLPISIYVSILYVYLYSL